MQSSIVGTDGIASYGAAGSPAPQHFVVRWSAWQWFKTIVFLPLGVAVCIASVIAFFAPQVLHLQHSVPFKHCCGLLFLGLLILYLIGVFAGPSSIKLAYEENGWKISLHCRFQSPWEEPLKFLTGIKEVSWSVPDKEQQGKVTAGYLHASPGWCLFFSDGQGWMASLCDHDGFLARLTQICGETDHEMHPALVRLMKVRESTGKPHTGLVGKPNCVNGNEPDKSRSRSASGDFETDVGPSLSL